MKSVLLITVLLFSAVDACSQARTAERVVDVPFSRLNEGNPPNGSIRNVINGMPGSTPCTSGPTNALAYKVAGVWQCPKLSPGAGTGDTLGASASSDGEMAVYVGIGGKLLGRSNTLNGIPFLTAGVVTALGSSGTGNVVRASSATLSSPTLLTPTIGSFSGAQHPHDTGPGGGQLNASNVFSAGTIPPARIISGAIVNSRCLRVSNVGQIEVAADDCGTGSGGTPGGVSGNLLFNESGAVGGIVTSAYNSVTGRLTYNQMANANDTIYSLRFTDTSPTGTYLRFRNAVDTSDVFRVNTDGSLAITSTITSTNVAAPGTPAAGLTAIWTDVTDKNLRAKDDAGNVSGTVRAFTCSSTDKISGISSAGVVTCSADQITGGGSGITDLNTLVATSQTFADVDDTNVTLAISSVTSTHTFTLGWAGRLDIGRMDINTVANDVGNIWSTGAQDMGAATSFKVPTAAGASPTASGLLAVDLTSNTWEAGVNGTNRTFTFTAGAQTLSDKTLDNTTTYAARDTLFTLQDNADATKTVNFELGGLTTATNRVVTIANAASVTVQPTTATANQWLTHIDSTGLQVKAQPAFTNISGTLGETQGGTGQTSWTQGDIPFASAANTLSKLAKNTSATRYLSNTGASNNPAWAQVNLTNGVTGILPAANILATVTNSRCLRVNSSGVIEVHSADCGAGGGGSGDMILADAQTVTGAKTFDPGKLIVGSVADAAALLALPVVLKSFVTQADTGELYFGIPGSPSNSWAEVFLSGLSVVNLASANVSGILPVANGGTGFSDTTFSGNTHKLVTTTGTLTSGRCVQIDASGNFVQAADVCGAGGGGGGSPGGSGSELQFRGGASTFSAVTGSSVSGANVTLTGSLNLVGTDAGHFEFGEGPQPAVVANRITITAPTDVPASGYVYVLPSDSPTNGEQLTANISGTTVTLSWATAGGGGDALVANPLSQFAATTSAQLAGVISDETGTGALMFGTSPAVTTSLTTPSTTFALVNATATTVNFAGAATTLNIGASATTILNFGGSTTAAEFRYLEPSGSGTNFTAFKAVAQSANITYSLPATVGAAGSFLRDVAGNGVLDWAVPGGAGTINSGVTNVIPKYTAATTIDDSLLSDNGTTLTYTGTGGISAALYISSGSGPGYVEIPEGTPAPALVANAVQLVAATDVPAGGIAYLFGSVAAGSGVLRVANFSGTMTVTQDAGISHLAASTSADLAGVLSDETGSGGGFVRATSPTIASPTFTGTVTIPTPFTLGAVSVLPTGTELNFVDGVTSAIQTQLDAKAPLASPVFTTQITTPKVVWTGAVQDLSGAGTPEGAITAAIGSVYRRTDGGASTSLYLKESGAGNTGWVALGAAGGGGAPTGATYITQTADGTLSAEQALSGLSTGIMRVATTTGVITSLTDSAGIAANISNETGTGVLVFDTSPAITTSLTTGSTTFALLNTTATTVNAFGATTTLNLGASATMILNLGGSTTASELRFLEPSGSGTNYTAFKAKAQTANITYTLPDAVGAAGTFLQDAAGDGVLSWAAPSGSGTVTATGGSLTANSVVLGAGTTDTKVVAGITTNGTAQLVLGVNTTTLGSVKLFGNTSGDATIQPAAVAGTATVLTLPATTGTLALTSQLPVQYINAINFATLPDASGAVFLEPYPIKATNDFFKHAHFIFNDTATDDSLYGSFELDRACTSGCVVTMTWTTTATSGNARFSFAYRVVTGDDTTSLDQTTAAETVTVVDTAPSAVNERMVITFTLTDANFATAGTVEWKLIRTGTTSDTMAAAAQLVSLRFSCTP